MTPTVETQLAIHQRRLDEQENTIVRIERSLDRIVYGMLATLATAVGSLLVLLLKK